MSISPSRGCPEFVGRESELGVLRTALTTAGSGTCRVLTIGGEAGIGKSRLAAELVTSAASDGWTILTGNCSEHDVDLPLALFADALRQMFALDRARALTALDGLTETLGDLLPELRSEESTVRREFLAPEQAKRLRFEALALAMSRFAVDQPLLALFEDLHWADPTSLELLELLPRRLTSLPVLIVGTLRFDNPTTDLVRCLTNLRRARYVDEVALEPLSGVDVGRMLDVLMPGATPVSTISIVHRRTGGNPFFVEELVAGSLSSSLPAWLSADAQVPRSIGDLVARQLATLDEPARQIVALAAVIGQRIEPADLLAASDWPETTLAAAVDALVEQRLLVEIRSRGRPALAFRHALTREAIHDRLLPSQRRALHRAVASALRAAESAGRMPNPAELGYHCHAGELWELALAYSTEAGDLARRGNATIESLGHYRRALDAALALDHPSAAQLHHRCGQALSLLGAFDEARENLDQTLRLARSAKDLPLEQAALADLAALYASRDYATAEQHATAALDRARAICDPRREASALNLLGNILTNRLLMAEGRMLHEDAADRYIALGDRWGTADALDHMGMARYLSGEIPEARQAFGRAAVAFEELGDPVRMASALTSRGQYFAVLEGPCATDVGPDGYRPDAEKALRLTEELAWRAGESYARVALASVALGEANFGEAERQAHHAHTIAEEIDHQQWQVLSLFTLGIIDADLLDDRSATLWFERALALAEAIGSAQWVERIGSWLAHCQGRVGDRDQALTRLVKIIPTEAPPATIGQRRALLTLAEIDLARDRPEAALLTLDRLLSGAAGPRPAGAVLMRADALAATGRVDEADATYLDASRIADELGPRPVIWRAAAGRAALWRGRDRAIVESESLIARSEIAFIAASIPDRERRATFLARPPVAAFAPTDRSSDTAQTGPEHLTRRQRQVAQGVARGLSNKQIARELFIAEKTVEMHVGHCLEKLELSSRAHLAAWIATDGHFSSTESPRPD